MAPIARLVASLTHIGRLCEQCLARHAELTTETVSTAILELRQHVAMRLEHGPCAGCNQITWVCSLWGGGGIRRSRW